MNISWHILSGEEALKKTGSAREGLDDAAARQRLAKYGKNELQAKKKINPLFIFLRQFLDVMILVLAVAALLAAFIGDVTDTVIIVVLIVLNAIIGFIQEYRAEKAMEALQKMAAPVSHVMRNRKLVELPASELVPGDIVMLKAGDIVPADIRLLETHSLNINESSLTGESNAVDKGSEPIKDENLPLGDRKNMGFMGTFITKGHGKGLVVATQMQTELGRIAGMLGKTKSITPLQKRLRDFSRRLTVIIIVLCIALFILGYLKGEEVNRMLLTSISLAVAVIPEALPAVVTISLALGARRMVKQQALVRKLYAVETLGSVTYICTDKTGTLTKNEMKVQEVWVPDESQ